MSGNDLGENAPALVVTGMAKEMRIAQGPGAVVIGSGGDAAQLWARLAERTGHRFRAVLSFGIAGALDPTLRPGAVIVGNEVSAGSGRWAADRALRDVVLRRLAQDPLEVALGGIAGSDVPVMSAADKRAIWDESGAAAVDMESHIAAEFAAAEGLPFAAVRVICDPAGRTLPPLAAIALRPNGAVNFAGIARSLARNPAQLAALPRLAADAAAAFRSLSRCGDLLGVGRGLPDFRELLGDIA